MTGPGSAGSPEEPEPDAPQEQLTPSAEGPPGGRIFSLEGRRAPGLYLVAWVLSVGGAALIFLAMIANTEGARLALALVGGVSLMVGLAAAAGSQVVERQDRRSELYRGPSPLLLFGLFFAVVTFVAVLLFSIGPADPNAPLGFASVTIVQGLIYAAAVWLFVVKTGSMSWSAMGWPTRRPGWLRESLVAAGTGIGVMLLAVVPIGLLGAALSAILGVTPPDIVPTPSNTAEALAIAAGVALIVPVAEELFFRGYALTAWLRDLGPRAALARSTVFFALVHILNITADTGAEGAATALLIVAVILPVGLILGWLFLRRGMVGAIAGHATYNLIGLLALLQ